MKIYHMLAVLTLATACGGLSSPQQEPKPPTVAYFQEPETALGWTMQYGIEGTYTSAAGYDFPAPSGPKTATLVYKIPSFTRLTVAFDRSTPVTPGFSCGVMPPQDWVPNTQYPALPIAGACVPRKISYSIQDAVGTELSAGTLDSAPLGGTWAPQIPALPTAAWLRVFAQGNLSLKPVITVR